MLEKDRSGSPALSDAAGPTQVGVVDHDQIAGRGEQPLVVIYTADLRSCVSFSVPLGPANHPNNPSIQNKIPRPLFPAHFNRALFSLFHLPPSAYPPSNPAETSSPRGRPGKSLDHPNRGKPDKPDRGGVCEKKPSSPHPPSFISYPSA